LDKQGQSSGALGRIGSQHMETHFIHRTVRKMCVLLASTYMGAERIVLMTVHFSRWWNTPTVTSDSVLDVRTAEHQADSHPTGSMQVIQFNYNIIHVLLLLYICTLKGSQEWSYFEETHVMSIIYYILLMPRHKLSVSFWFSTMLFQALLIKL